MKYKNSVEILDRKAQLQKRCKEIIKQCRTEVREMNDDEKEEVENAKTEIEQLKEELKQLQQRLAELDKVEKEIEEEEVVEEVEDKQQEDVVEDDEDKENKQEIKSNIRNMKKQKFSLLRAINDVVNNRNFDQATQSVINAGAEEMRKNGVSFTGQIQLPLEQRTITVANEGADVIGVDIMDIEAPLRAKNVLVNAGAKYLTGLQNDVVIPIMTGNNVGWEDEIGEAKDGGASFTSVKLSPKRLTCFLDLSKKFLAQSESKSTEELLKQDIINALNSKLEATILGDGEETATQPAGIFNGKTIDGATDTFAKLTNLEASVEDANTLGTPCYVMSNSAKGSFRAMAKSTKNTQLVMEAGQIDGTEVYNTSNVKKDHFIYGDFSNLAIGQWGGLDLIVDPYSQAKDGKVRIVVNAYFDAKVLRDEAFAVGKVQ